MPLEESVKDGRELPSSKEQGEEVASSSQTADSPYTITVEILRRRMEKPSKGRYITQLYSCVTVSLCAVCFGTALAWSSPASKQLEVYKMYNLTEDSFSTITSMLPLGCSVGVTVWSLFIESFGPRKTVIIQSPFLILSWVFMSTLNRPSVFLISRFFCGFLSISYLLCGERLLVDSVHIDNLRHMVAIFRSSTILGVLVTYILGQYFKKEELGNRCAILAALTTILLLFIPESPVYLYKKNQHRALKALQWYRGEKDTEDALHRIRKDAEIRIMQAGTNSTYILLYHKVVLKAVAIIICLTFFQVFSGYYAFLFYNYQIWNDFCYSVVEPEVVSIIFGVTMYFSCLFSSYINFTLPFGVRKPALISQFFISLQLVIMFCYEFYKPYTTLWITATALHLYVVAYECGLSTTPTALFYEYLPYEVYAKVRIAVGVCLWFFIFVLTRFFLRLKNEGGYTLIFGLFASTTIVGYIFSWTFVVETKNRSLMEIQVAIGGNPVGTRPTVYGRRVYRRSLAIH